jgi:superfamily II DNA or RNA helicase
MKATATDNAGRITRRGFVIDKAALDDATLKKVRHDLTVVPPKDFTNPFGSAAPPFQIYLENAQRLCLPRHYATAIAGLPLASGAGHAALVDGACPERENLQFVGGLNAAKQQDEAVARSLEAFRAVGGGILSLPTGYGKTVVGIYIMCQLKLKTLIVVHKDFLVDQWKERIRSFAPRARVGFIRQNVTDTENKDVIIAMLQSLVLKEYSHSIFQDIGLAIFDEVHHLSAPVFSRALFKVCPPYALGLSATPQRKDGLSWVIEQFVGPVFFQVSRKREAHVSVAVTPYEDRAGRYDDLPRLPDGRHYNFTAIVSLLCEDARRNAWIVREIGRVLEKEPARSVLVLSDRRSHCEELLRLLEGAALSPEARAVEGGGRFASVYYGGLKKQAMRDAEKSKVIFATFSFANEGLDIQALNTIFFTTPKGDIVQAVGRILRDGGGGDLSVQPLVVDIVDRHTYFETKYSQRRTYYRKAGFLITDDRAANKGKRAKLNDGSAAASSPSDDEEDGPEPAPTDGYCFLD